MKNKTFNKLDGSFPSINKKMQEYQCWVMFDKEKQVTNEWINDWIELNHDKIVFSLLNKKEKTIKKGIDWYKKI